MKPNPADRRSGTAAVAALFWILALALFVAPFLRPQAARDPEGLADETRSELDRPYDERVAEVGAELGVDLESAVAAASEELFGEDSEHLAATGLVDLARVRAGRVAYRVHCIGCHGETGDGAGPAAEHLNPRPRNVRSGMFKFTSTDTGRKPLRADLFGTLTRGLAGSSMPDFRLLSDEIRWDLVEYVRYLAIRGEFELLAVELARDDEEIPDMEEVAELIVEQWDPATLRAVYPAIAETERTEESIERGRELYLDTSVANCATCHGPEGKGKGPSATAFNDHWGYPLAPRDLTTGVFRAGSGPEDLYRSIATGVSGTPMPAFAGSLTPEQIWDLVHFVQSLAE